MARKKSTVKPELKSKTGKPESQATGADKVQLAGLKQKLKSAKDQLQAAKRAVRVAKAEVKQAKAALKLAKKAKPAKAPRLATAGVASTVKVKAPEKISGKSQRKPVKAKPATKAKSQPKTKPAASSKQQKAANRSAGKASIDKPVVAAANPRPVVKKPLSSKKKLAVAGQPAVLSPSVEPAVAGLTIGATEEAGQ